MHHISHKINCLTLLQVDVISDLLLVVVPLWIFWRDKKLTPMSRLVIKFGFAANGVTAVASLITGVILLVTFTDMSTRISTHILVSKLFTLLARALLKQSTSICAVYHFSLGL